MNDRSVSLLEQYDIEVLKTYKGRGTILCDTDVGCMTLKEYAGREDRLAVQSRLLAHIAETGLVNVERIVPTREGALWVKDGDGVTYILKTCSSGRECNINDKNECFTAVKLLAKLHGCMEFSGAEDETEDATADEQVSADNPWWMIPMTSPEQEYERHNRELKRARRYLKQRSQKSWFEIELFHTFDTFLEQAQTVAAKCRAYREDREMDSGASRRITFCHGDYQYHNIMRQENGWMIVNFEKCVADSPMRDLHLLMRKLLEKSDWSIALGEELLNAYHRERPLSAEERMDLYYRFAYPEKFWKIVNFYYNSGKAWIPERNSEKLAKLLKQEPARQRFLNTVFK